MVDDDGSGPNEAVEPTSLRYRCVEPFKRQRIAHGVRIDTNLGGSFDERIRGDTAGFDYGKTWFAMVVFELVGSTQQSSRFVRIPQVCHTHIVCGVPEPVDDTRKGDQNGQISCWDE